MPMICTYFGIQINWSSGCFTRKIYNFKSNPVKSVEMKNLIKIHTFYDFFTIIVWKIKVSINIIIIRNL